MADKFAGSERTSPDRSADYNLQMEYSTTGEINKKTQVHNKNGFGVTANTYTHAYNHESSSHSLENIINQNEAKKYFEYDNNGNLTRTERNNVVSSMQWDEANRLKMTRTALIRNTRLSGI